MDVFAMVFAGLTLAVCVLAAYWLTPKRRLRGVAPFPPPSECPPATSRKGGYRENAKPSDAKVLVAETPKPAPKLPGDIDAPETIAVDPHLKSGGLLVWAQVREVWKIPVEYSFEDAAYVVRTRSQNYIRIVATESDEKVRWKGQNLARKEAALHLASAGHDLGDLWKDAKIL